MILHVTRKNIFYFILLIFMAIHLCKWLWWWTLLKTAIYIKLKYIAAEKTTPIINTARRWIPLHIWSPRPKYKTWPLGSYRASKVVASMISRRRMLQKAIAMTEMAGLLGIASWLSLADGTSGGYLSFWIDKIGRKIAKFSVNLTIVYLNQKYWVI